jgi:uncharacterized cupin superfamily protein
MTDQTTANTPTKTGGSGNPRTSTPPATDSQSQANTQATEKSSEGVKTYKLLRGKHTYVNAQGQTVVARKGDSVPLTDNQLHAFKDKFLTRDKSVEEAQSLEDV